MVTRPWIARAMANSRAATQPGTAAHLGESFKSRKYPHLTITPFVLETLGRLGEQARACLRTALREPHFSTTTSQIHSATLAHISTALQRGSAKAIREATG